MVIRSWVGIVFLLTKLKDTESVAIQFAFEVVAAVVCSSSPPTTMPGESPPMGLQTINASEPCDDEVEMVELSKSKLKRGVIGGRWLWGWNRVMSKPAATQHLEFAPT